MKTDHIPGIFPDQEHDDVAVGPFECKEVSLFSIGNAEPDV